MKLHEQVKVLKRIVEAQQEMVADIKRYIGSPKYSGQLEGVNPQDLFLRFNEHEQIIGRIEDEMCT
jgi:hypothetical protein